MTQDFIHRYLPGTSGETLLLLHGTGGDEGSLMELGRILRPEANLLSPRGQVLEGGRLPRFFRRLAEGVFDVPDLIARTGDLAQFVTDSAGRYGFDPTRVTAVGFSNGANIAASLLLLHPGILSRAVLLRAMVPLEPEARRIDGTRVWVGAGRHDPIVPPSNTARLAELLTERGAEVKLDWREAGHQLAGGEVEAIAHWLN
ncbi:MAG TPA: alpha/beta hydrolase [Gemmatimonadales bacterium]|nr:alpha/beta hydrolase [Gemmatimonadales bacterium]